MFNKCGRPAISAVFYFHFPKVDLGDSRSIGLLSIKSNGPPTYIPYRRKLLINVDPNKPFLISCRAAYRLRARSDFGLVRSGFKRLPLSSFLMLPPSEPLSLLSAMAWPNAFISALTLSTASRPIAPTLCLTNTAPFAPTGTSPRPPAVPFSFSLAVVLLSYRK